MPQSACRSSPASRQVPPATCISATRSARCSPGDRAREAGGRFLLRLEDIDPARCRPEFAAAILEDLAWLGLDWDGEVRVQSQHLAEYRAALDTLAARGLLYPCFCTPRRHPAIAAAAPHTPGWRAASTPAPAAALSQDERAARIAAGEPYALRLDMDRALASSAGTA